MSGVPERTGGPGAGGKASVGGGEGSRAETEGSGRNGDAARSRAGDALAVVALSTFRLNGRLLEAAERMSRPAGLTAAWWQVLGAVLGEPLPVSGIARAMGITRQSVQRIADLLVDRGLAEYRPNPAHRRAKLLRPTAAGLAAVREVVPHQHTWAERLVAEVGAEELERAGAVLRALAEAVETVGPPAPGTS